MDIYVLVQHKVRRGGEEMVLQVTHILIVKSYFHPTPVMNRGQE